MSKPTTAPPPVCRALHHTQYVTVNYAATHNLTAQPVTPQESRRLVAVPQSAVWLEMRLNGEWMAACRLAMQDGQPVISELRVFPHQPGKRQMGTWSGNWHIHAPVPRGGLTSRLLRQVRAGAVADHLTKILTHVKEMDPKWEAAFYKNEKNVKEGLRYISLLHPSGPFLGLQAAPTRSAVGRKGHPDTEYAAIAQTYVHALRSGSRTPIEMVAKARRLSVAQARDLVHRARIYDFLTKATKQGRAGGALTPKAEALLKTLTHKGRAKHGAKK